MVDHRARRPLGGCGGPDGRAKSGQNKNARQSRKDRSHGVTFDREGRLSNTSAPGLRTDIQRGDVHHVGVEPRHESRPFMSGLYAYVMEHEISVRGTLCASGFEVRAWPIPEDVAQRLRGV